MEIVSESLDEWLSTLKPFQRNTIKNLLQNNDGNEEKVAELWLNSFGPINTATYGGVPTSASDKIASLLAPVIGVSISVLAPAIVLMLHVISKVSVNAYCNMVR